MKQTHCERPYCVCFCVCVWTLPGVMMPANNSSETDYKALSDASSHTQLSTQTRKCCPSALDLPWLLGHHSNIPLCFFDPFSLLHPMWIWVCVLCFHWPWANIGSCSCQLLAQLRATFIAFPRRARGLRARACSTLGHFPFLLKCFTLLHPSAQIVLANLEKTYAATSQREVWEMHPSDIGVVTCYRLSNVVETEMDQGPERADAVVTRVSPHPVAHPVRPAARTLTHYRRKGAEEEEITHSLFIHATEKHQWSEITHVCCRNQILLWSICKETRGDC